MTFTREGLVTVLLVIGALTVGSVVVERLPKAEDVMDQRFVTYGTLGQSVGLRTGTITVTKVEASRTVSSALGRAVTNGIFVILHVEVTAIGKPLSLDPDDARLVALDGRQFGGDTPVSTACGPAQPGVPLECEFTLEAVPDALAGAHVRLPAAATLIVGPPETEFADIDLGITGAGSADLGAQTAPIKLRGPRPKGA